MEIPVVILTIWWRQSAKATRHILGHIPKILFQKSENLFRNKTRFASFAVNNCVMTSSEKKQQKRFCLVYGKIVSCFFTSLKKKVLTAKIGRCYNYKAEKKYFNLDTKENC